MDKNYRFGLIVPSANVVIEPEYYSINLKEVCFYTSRLLSSSCTPQELQKMAGYSEKAALELSTACVDAILYACTAGSLIKGLDWEKKLVKRINEISQTPTISTAGAVIEALHFMKIYKVHMFTPYIDEINLEEKKYLEQSGIDVLGMKGLGITKSVEIADVNPDLIFNEVVDLYKKDQSVQGVFISCTNFKTFPIIDKIESYLNIPVITSNQASLWGLLNIIKFNKPINGLGQLFK